MSRLTWTLPAEKPAPPVNLNEDPLTELFPDVSNSLILIGIEVFPMRLGSTILEFAPSSFSVQQTSTLGSQNCS